MKHLTTYKLFESGPLTDYGQRIEDVAMDTLADLKDIGYKVKVRKFMGGNGFIVVTISSEKEFFKIDDVIKSSVIELTSQLSGIGLSFDCIRTVTRVNVEKTDNRNTTQPPSKLIEDNLSQVGNQDCQHIEINYDFDKVNESKYDDELLDIFNNITTNTHTSSFTFKHGTDNTAHVLWGERMEHDDHQLLKNLYDYRSILTNMYNMDYFYVYMNEQFVIVVLYDRLTEGGLKSYVPYIRLDRSKTNLPNNIQNLLYKEQSDWRGFKALQSGIRKTNGDSSNLALFDWIYAKTYESGNHLVNQAREISQYVNDLFSDIKAEGVRIFTHNHLPGSYTVNIGEYSDQVKFKYSDISDEVKHMISYFIEEHNMRLGDVDAELVQGKILGNKLPPRLLGWEKLKHLLENNNGLVYSLSIRFMGRGTTLI